MNNELIERINIEIAAAKAALPYAVSVRGSFELVEARIATLEDCKAALTQQQEAEPVDEDEMFDWIYKRAKDSMRRARGQQITIGDGPDSHLIWAALAWARLHPPKPAAQPQVPEGIVEKYNELLYYVARKFPNESRHETALRYIKNAESAESYCAAAKEEGK